MSVQFPRHAGIKCYAVISGQCWLAVQGLEPILLRSGDCFLLPRGLPFRLATDLALPPVDLHHFLAAKKTAASPTVQSSGGDHSGAIVPQTPPAESPTQYIVGGFFALTGSHAEILLQSLPPIVHIRSEADKATMRWSLERMREELANPQPGGSLIAQQLACMMLVQALRLHLAEGAGVGWLFALADKHMSAAITAMHDNPGYPWTLHELAARVGMSRSIFAQRFKHTVGSTPMEYLARWRMLLAGDRLQNSPDSLSSIAQSLGYESDSAFGKAFRRVMGCSPRKYSRSRDAASHSSQAA
jgi:AraC-like DNA-binding protein